MNELDDLAGMAMFVRIVDEGSLSAAGRALGLPKASISRNLSLLEARLGTPLLIRSTRALSLTDAGRRYYDRVQPIVRNAREATSELMSDSVAPSGLLRVSAPVAYGQTAVAPRLMAFMDRHPAVRIELHLDDGRVNLAGEGFDLAVRMGPIDDSELICRKLADIDRVIVASPSWLKQHGTPQQPADLAHHAAVVTRPDMVHWQIGGETLRMPWRMSTGNMMLTRDAARAGVGLALVPDFLVQDDLARGTLVRVLPALPIPATQATALYARTARLSIALKALLEALLVEVPGTP